MRLQPFEIVNGISLLIYVSITIILGLVISSKYFKEKNRTFLLVGLTWIFMSFAWVAGVISFFYTLTTSKMISVSMYLFFGFTFLPLAMFTWFIAFSDLVYNEYQKIILIIAIIYGVVFEVIFLYLLFTNPNYLAILHSPLEIEYKLFIQLYLASILIIIFVTGITFAIKTRKVQPDMKWRGNLLLIAFISIIIGSIFDTIFTQNIILILLKRLLLISASFEFYCCFSPPKLFKKAFIKE